MTLKLLLASAAGVFLATGVALAQPAPPPPPPADGAPPKADARMAPDDAGTVSDDDDAADMPPPPPPGGPDRMGGPKGPRMGGPGGPGWRHGPPPPPPTKAAEFRIQNGPFRFHVKCAEDEPMQACADIAAKLFEQAKSLPPAPPPPR